MIVEFHPNFKKSYKKRIFPQPKLVTKTKERIELFQKNPKHPLLKDHQLKGDKADLRSFSITGDIRITYFPVSNNHSLFIDIGSHNQVY